MQWLFFYVGPIFMDKFLLLMSKYGIIYSEG